MNSTELRKIQWNY